MNVSQDTTIHNMPLEPSLYKPKSNKILQNGYTKYLEFNVRNDELEQVSETNYQRLKRLELLPDKLKEDDTLLFQNSMILEVHDINSTNNLGHMSDNTANNSGEHYDIFMQKSCGF